MTETETKSNEDTMPETEVSEKNKGTTTMHSRDLSNVSLSGSNSNVEHLGTPSLLLISSPLLPPLSLSLSRHCTVTRGKKAFIR